MPDHADWLYQTGEHAKIEVSFYKYGVPRDGVVKYEIGNDMLPADKYGSLTLKNGRAVLDMGSRKDPGFRERPSTLLHARWETYQHHVKVGFSVDKVGHAMYGYLFYPKDAKKGSHPVVLCPPGAGIKTIRELMKNYFFTFCCL